MAGGADGSASAQVEFRSMGTLMSLRAYGSGARPLLGRCRDVALRVERLLSHTQPWSDLSLINAAAGRAVGVHPETDAVLARARDLCQATDGLFDPVLGALVDLWEAAARGSAGPGEPEPSRIDAALELCGIRHLSRDGMGRYRLTPGARLDLGGVGKGHAAQAMADELRALGVSSALLSLGSSTIAALGRRPDGRRWRVGIRAAGGVPASPDWPRRTASRLAGSIEVADELVSTSGAEPASHGAAGSRARPVLDPRTGRPCASGLASVTVIAEDGALAEAVSTAALVLGADAALEFQRRHGGFEAVMVSSDGAVGCTPGALQRFQPRAAERNS